MMASATSADAKATALLVGRFGKGEAKPLSRADFNRVAQSLHRRGLRPADLFSQVPTDLPVSVDRIQALILRGTALALAAENWNQLGIGLVSRADPLYPARFRRLLKGSSAPIIFYAGNLRLLEGPTIGVVGSRDATKAGLDAARHIGERAATERVAVVSGDARGIDRAAMDAALDANGQVIGILADSMGKSVLTKRYRNAIADGRLLLLSPNEPEARFTVTQAMERNRYIYAASDAVIVADSDVKGGTWAGALENVRHGWTAAHVRVDEPCREGNAALAREGLAEWRSSWLTKELPLSALFATGRSQAELLPLFTEAKEPRNVAVSCPEPHCLAIASADVAAPKSVATPGPKLAEPNRPESDDQGGRAGEQTDASWAAPAGGHAEPRSDRDALFEMFLARLAGALPENASTTLVADRFGIEPIQAEAWLRRALKLGVVKRQGEHGWRWCGEATAIQSRTGLSVCN